MSRQLEPEIEAYRFRDLHPRIHLGTSTDRFAGWIGTVYTPGRWEEGSQSRTRKIGGRSFTSRVLPVASVTEYFQRFPALELDFTFYQPLLGPEGGPSPAHRTLERYAAYLGEEDRILLKAPQAVTARRLRRASGWVANPDYLSTEMLLQRFFEPADRILGRRLRGIILEQGYEPKAERREPQELAAELDAFFGALPPDERYHLELRTEAYLVPPVFEVLRAHGVGQVYSHWTWLPPLLRQYQAGEGVIRNRRGDCILRLMTPPRVRYQDAFVLAHPFDRLVPELLNPHMVPDAAEITLRALEAGGDAYVVVNNKAGGSAPRVAKLLAEELLRRLSEGLDKSPP